MWGCAARTLVAQELTKANIKFTAVDADPNLTDFTAQILRFKSTSPPFDFFLSIYSEAGAYPMIRQAHDLGFAPTAALRHLQLGRRGGRSDLLGECRRGRQVPGHRECRPAEGGVERQDQGVRRGLPREAQRRSVRRGDGKLRRRVAAVRCDQDRPAAPTPRRSSTRWRTPAMSARAASIPSPPATSRPGTTTSSWKRR